MGNAVVVAVVVGAAIAFQVFLVGRVSKDVHPLAISTTLQLSGVLVGMLWTTVRGAGAAVFRLTIAWWWLPLGALGWGIVAALGFAAARLGAGTTLAIVVGTQLIAGLVLDRAAGQSVIGIRQPVGIVLLIGGAVLVSSRGG